MITLVVSENVLHVETAVEKTQQAADRKTIALAGVWCCALALGVSLSQLEIFLIAGPLSAGVYLLFPSATREDAAPDRTLPGWTRHD